MNLSVPDDRDYIQAVVRAWSLRDDVDSIITMGAQGLECIQRYVGDAYVHHEAAIVICHA